VHDLEFTFIFSIDALRSPMGIPAKLGSENA
jgi:hypothetical protein